MTAENLLPVTDLIWLALALAGGWLASHLRLPVFVGFLVTGLALGLAGATASALLWSVGEVGVLLLLFAVGLHLRPANLVSRPVLVGGSIHLALSTALFVSVATLLGLVWTQALLWGVLLSFSSTVLAARTLDHSNQLGAVHGRVAIGVLILQDLVAVGVMVVVADVAPSVWAIGLLPGLLALRWLLWWALPRIHSDDLYMMLALLLAVGLAELFAHLHLSLELGAITAGALLAGHPRADRLSKSLDATKELFLVGFFLSVGMQVSPTGADWLMAAGLNLLLPLKAWLFLAILTWCGLRLRSAFLAGVSLTSYSEFTLIAGAVAFQYGMLSERALGVLTLATVLSFVVHLPVNRLSHALYDRWYRWLRPFDRLQDNLDQPSSSIGVAHYLVIGMGRTGSAAFDYLHSQDFTVTGLDADPDVIEHQLNQERRVAFGDALDAQFWQALRLTHLRGVVIALPNAEARLRATELLRHRLPEVIISTFALHQDEAQALRRAGATQVSYLLAEAGERLAELSLAPDPPTG